MSLVRIEKHEGRISVPNNETPIIELDLDSSLEIISVDLRLNPDFFSDRVTSDWNYTVYTAWRKAV